MSIFKIAIRRLSYNVSVLRIAKRQGCRQFKADAFNVPKGGHLFVSHTLTLQFSRSLVKNTDAIVQHYAKIHLKDMLNF